MSNPYISGTGFYLPPRVVINDDLSKYMDTTDEWIQERTGIKERRYVEKGVGSSDLAIPATKQALAKAGLHVSDIELIIFATSTPDFYAPGAGCLLQEKMGFNEIGALVTLIGRVDKMNPRYRYGNGYLWQFLKIQLRDDRIYPWQSINQRIQNILRSENGF